LVLEGCERRGPKDSLVAPEQGTGRRARKPPADTDSTDRMRVHFIDVGQGDATLLEFPCGVVVIDTGGELNAAFDGEIAYRQYLERFFATRPDLNRRIDLLAITHPHIDHTRSVDWTLENFEVGNVLDNGQVVDEDPGSPPQQRLMAWADERASTGHHSVGAVDIPAESGWTDEVIDPVGSCAAADTDPQIRLLWGRVIDHDGTYGENPNDHSLVIRVDYGASSVLFTGDLQMMGLARMSKHFSAAPEVFDVDIYQVGHHGSHNATKPYFVDLMSPRVAVVSAGAYERDLDWTARRYGHPHRKAIYPLLDRDRGVTEYRNSPRQAMLGVRGAWEETPSEFEEVTIEKAVYATAWDGHVVIDAHANGWLEVGTER
jgi:competence protein ComEC